MRILSLDISSSTGWALMEEGPRVVEYGNVSLPKLIKDYGSYPLSYSDAAHVVAFALLLLVRHHAPDVVVVEETNKARARYSQKFLEFTHAYFLDCLRDFQYPRDHVKYISTSTWRKTLGLRLTAEQKKDNARLSRAKSKVRGQDGRVDAKKLNVEKKKLGIRGKVTWKHVAVSYAAERFGVDFKQKDNDVADALCLGSAFFAGAPVCDGISERK